MSCQRRDHVLWHCVRFGVQHSLTPRALLTLIPALVVSNINYYNSVLAGVSVHSCTLSGQTAVRAKCCGSADLLGNEVRTHQPATAPTPLAVCSGCTFSHFITFVAQHCHTRPTDMPCHRCRRLSSSLFHQYTVASYSIDLLFNKGNRAFPVAMARARNGLPYTRLQCCCPYFGTNLKLSNFSLICCCCCIS